MHFTLLIHSYEVEGDPTNDSNSLIFLKKLYTLHCGVTKYPYFFYRPSTILRLENINFNRV